METLDRFQPEIVHIQHLMGLPVEIVDQLVARQIPFVIALHDYWYGCANAQLLTNTDQTICAGPDEQATNCAHCALARAGLPSAAVVLAPVLAPVMRRRNALLAWVFAAASLVIAPNEFVRSTYAAMGLPVNQVVVLPWGMDLPPDLPEIRLAAELARADRPPGELHLGYVGSLSHQKGIHVLVEAFNRLPISWRGQAGYIRQPGRFPGVFGRIGTKGDTSRYSFCRTVAEGGGVGSPGLI
ncbi:MAG: glycosyltransferase [Chloroflexota bacterium]